MPNRTRTILSSALALAGLFPLALASFMVDFEGWLNVAYQTTKAGLNIAVVGICKLAHSHTAHEFWNTGDEAFLMKPKVFEGICEPFFKLANTMLDCG